MLTKLKNMVFGKEYKTDPEDDGPVVYAPVTPQENRKMKRRIKKARRIFLKEKRKAKPVYRGQPIRVMDGRKYAYDDYGTIRCLEPKNFWTNKAEMKRYKKARRLARRNRKENP